MKRLFRMLFRLALFALVILAGVLAINTITFSSQQIPVEPVSPAPAIDGAPERLAAAIRLRTVSSVQPLDTAAFRQLDTLIRRSFPLADSLLDREPAPGLGIVMRWPGTNPNLAPILLTAHQDVVPAEAASLDQWRVPPFAGEIRGDTIWGRGALDDKISIFGLLEAAESLLRTDYLPARTVYFAFGHDEEIGGKDGAQALAKFFADRDIHFEYVLDEGSVVLEDALGGLDRPLAMIGITEKGYASLTLTARLEEGGHSSMPPPETAIGILSRAIDRLQQNPFPARIDGATAGLFQYAGPEMSLPYRVLFANLWLTEPLLTRILTADATSAAIVRTTTAPTILQAGVKDNVLPTEARAVVNFRILPGETVETVTEYVRRTIGDERVSIMLEDASTARDPAPLSNTEAFGFQVIQKSIQQIYPDAVVAPALVIAATDGRFYQDVADQVYRFLPVKLTRAELKSIHGSNERIAADQYQQAIRFYRRLIRNSCR